MKNCNIADNTRLVFDLIESFKDKMGMLMLIDFEKAFDSIDWSFINKCLTFFGFGVSVRKWVETLYSDIGSAVLYNGHISEFFPITRGVRQGDPLSPYLFLLCVEPLADAIKNSSSVMGIKVGKEEIVIGQYADDTFFLLDGSENSLLCCLELLELFGECSGLKLNAEKTKAVWLGDVKEISEGLLSVKKIGWVMDGYFTLLGIDFFLDSKKTVNNNYDKILQKIHNTLQPWYFRWLSLLGKIQVIKSLIVPKLVHLFTALPVPSDAFLKNLDSIFYQFIWNGKRDRIARKTLIGEIGNGGLKMIDISSFNKALKIHWVKKITRR